ncbi:MAG: effector-associated domain EAD1-containing protein [Isosphaerales bacterium]
MAATQQPTPEHYKRLNVVFKDAFDVDALIQLAMYNLGGFHRHDFDKTTIDTFLVDLYERLDRRDEWNTFLTAARKERATNRPFVTVCDEVLAYMHRDDPMKTDIHIRLKTILLEAFDLEELKELVREHVKELATRLEVIAHVNQRLEVVVVELIDAVERRSLVVQLVRGIQEMRPYRPDVRALASELGLSSAGGAAPSAT